MSSLAKKIDELLDPCAGESAPLTDEDEALISELGERMKTLDDEDAALSFKSVISFRGQCGLGGQKNYLVNTDRSRRYRVTVRTYWTQGIESGRYDRTYNISAGGNIYLGCTNTGPNLPIAYLRRLVVGEEPL